MEVHVTRQKEGLKELQSCKVTWLGFEDLNIKIKIFSFIRLYQA